MEKTRKKLLYICPHLSTGGQPQYAYKQIKHFIKEFDIEVVEINNSGGNAFVVQKNRIKSLVEVHTLGEDKSEIIQIIEGYSPDIIHFQEIPEFDLPKYDFVNNLTASAHPSIESPTKYLFFFVGFVISGSCSISLN